MLYTLLYTNKKRSLELLPPASPVNGNVILRICIAVSCEIHFQSAILFYGIIDIAVASFPGCTLFIFQKAYLYHSAFVPVTGAPNVKSEAISIPIVLKEIH